MRRRIWFVILAVLLISIGCSSPLRPNSPQSAAAAPSITDPAVQIAGSQEGVVNIKMGTANQSHKKLKEQETFKGHWQLLDDAGEIRAEGYMYHFGSLDPEETRLPLHWTAQLDEGAYRLLWGAPSIGSVITHFVVEVDGDVVNVHRTHSELDDVFPPQSEFVD